MERKIVLGIIITMACIGWGWLFYHAFGNTSVPSVGSGELLRLHVIANGDSVREQAVKLRVRDAVIRTLANDMETADDAEEAKRLTLMREDEIVAAAQNVLREAGEDDTVKVEVGRFAFPLRMYGDLVVPAGEYEAVRIIIGEGKGQNWWCVLFPPLCMVDAAAAVSTDEPNDKQEEKRIIYRSKVAELLGR
ncbi:MAG: stage II sporulation protein R [Selenomonadales bacterium]|nr:stage II sporulation protein R [Selenomonadales bacterium]